MLKQAAFDLYLSIHKPAGVDLEQCLNYKANGDDDCLNLGSAAPCPNCVAFDRLVQEFDGIAIG
jgi:hypothetical protein